MTVVDINDVAGLIVEVAEDTVAVDLGAAAGLVVNVTDDAVDVVLGADSIEVVAVTDETVEVVLAADSIRVVGTDAVGPPGPPGAPGAPGADGTPGTPGAPGPAGGVYRHVQGTPSAVWTISHGLGFYPGGIAVVDSSGGLHDGLVEYVDSNTIRVSFFAAGVAAAFSGEAYIS